MINYFVRQPGFRLKPISIVIFLFAAIGAWGTNILGYSFFPSPNMVPFLARTIITLITDLAMIYVSFRLLKQNGLPSKALGLMVSGKTITDILWGALIGIIAIGIIAGLLFVFIPYHFAAGSMEKVQAFQEGISYLVGNTLEELMFRGFLFIILSQLIGWPKAAIIAGILFGLFHLQGTGLTIGGLKMFATTASFSFVFSFTFVLFKSLWAPIFLHAVSNLFLHTITGLDGGNKALYNPVFEKEWPKGYDVALVVMILTSIILSTALYLSIRRRERLI